MNTRNPLLWACVIAAGSATAHADIFTWFANSGIWEDHNMWFGPAGQYPDSILDTATISGDNSTATLTQNLALGTLNVLNGADLFSSGHSIFVSADTQIAGVGSAISVTETPSLHDFDTDTLTISAGILAMNNGLAQIDEALIINSNGGVLGTGIIEMNSTTGNLDLDNGVLWATAGSIGDTLRLTRTNTSTAKLDWTSPESDLVVLYGKDIHNELPYSGSLGGRIWVSGAGGTARFISDNAFVAASGSEFRLSAGTSQSTARIEAPAIDSYGLVNVSGVGVIDAPIVALRGEIELDEDAWLTIPADVLIFDSLTINASGPNAIIQMSQPGSTLNVVGGLTAVSMGPGSSFDLDGSGNKTVNIADGSTLSLDAESLDFSNGSPFDGTLNIDGTLHVETIVGPSTWRNNGEINLDSGEITGRRLNNTGVIRGTGHVDAITINNGEIVADGGTLSFRSVGLDGDQNPADGIVRAQTGDLVMNMQANGATQFFTGSAFVGDGSGVREVLEMDINLVLQEANGITGSLDLNSGFVVLDDFTQGGELTVNGTSLIRTIGNNPEDRISFESQGVNTIVGTLEVDGETWFVPGAQFIGEGTIHAVSSVHRTFFQEDSDLSDVGLVSAGQVNLWSLFHDGQASMRSLTLESSAALQIDMGDALGPITAERFVILDQAALDGTLELNWEGNNPVPVGQTLTVLNAGSVIGAFDEIDDSGLGPNRRAFVTIDSDSVEVFVTCSADLNADGEANFFDVSEFLSQFNSLDPAADLNEDGQFNFFDISIFISGFNLGC